MAVLEVLQALSPPTPFFLRGKILYPWTSYLGNSVLKYKKLMLAIHLLCILVVVLDMDDNNVLPEFKHELQNISDDVGWEWINVQLLLSKTESDTIVFCLCFTMWVLLQPKNLDVLSDLSRNSQCQISWKSCVLVCGCFMYHMGKGNRCRKMYPDIEYVSEIAFV